MNEQTNCGHCVLKRTPTYSPVGLTVGEVYTCQTCLEEFSISPNPREETVPPARYWVDHRGKVFAAVKRGKDQVCISGDPDAAELVARALTVLEVVEAQMVATDARWNGAWGSLLHAFDFSKVFDAVVPDEAVRRQAWGWRDSYPPAVSERASSARSEGGAS